MGIGKSKKRLDDQGSAGHEEKMTISHYRDERKAPRGTKQEKLEGELGRTMALEQHKLRQGIEKEAEVLCNMVKVPVGEAIEDWLAVNTIHFFNIASMVYGTVSNDCSPSNCPQMSAGAKYVYFWDDKDIAACDHIAKMFDWIESLISDPNVFPKHDAAAYPSDFEGVLVKIFTRLFRMYCHVYYSHFDLAKSIGVEKDLNSSFQHFSYFILEYKLVDKEEMKPLKKLLSKLLPTQYKP